MQRLLGGGSGLLKRVLLAGVYLGLLVAILVGLYAMFLYPSTPDVRSIQAARVERPTVVLDADGEEITRFQRVNRRWVSLDQIAPSVVDALIATEDHRFYQHNGIDVRRLFSAVGYSLLGRSQGGSTLTMQLARNLYPEEIGQADPLTRKLKELMTAAKIEKVLTKREILETYLNTVPFLYNAFGIELGARTYFSKPAKELTVLESATLVGMLKGNSYYNPVRYPERAKNRRNVVLSRMVATGKLTADRYESLRYEPLKTRFEQQPLRGSKAPHFTEKVKAMVIDWADEHGHDIYADGLVVRTTLDLSLQTLARESVARNMKALQAVADFEWARPEFQFISDDPQAYLNRHSSVRPFAHFWKQNPEVIERYIRESARYRSEVKAGADGDVVMDALLKDDAYLDSLRTAHTRLEAGFIAIDPATGNVKAWVGSRDFYKEEYDHVSDARRQPGSTFKPFVYATALDNGFSPDDTFPDKEVEIPLEGNRVWRPTNVEGVTGQDMTLREGLALSKNTITAQLIDQVGADKVASNARQMGIRKSKLDEVPSLALGTSPVTLLELAAAYGTFANGGTYHAPRMITRIEDANGKVLARFEPESEPALDQATAFTIVDMLRDAVDLGTGQRIRTTFGISADVAGKTGTTQNNADGWFMLMHPDLVAGAWVGFNDPRISFRSNYWGQGAHNALYLVGDFYSKAFARGIINAEASFPPAPTVDREQEEHNSFLDDIERWISGRKDEPEKPSHPEASGRDNTRIAPQVPHDRDQEEVEPQSDPTRRERMERLARRLEELQKRARERFESERRRLQEELNRDLKPDEKPKERKERVSW